MDYVFLDLEWNNAYCKKQKKNINEIIEIGAVKYNSDFDEIDRFDCIIRSQITRNLGKRFKNLTSISNEEMKEGISFSSAVESFKNWAGNDNLTITWSNSDLYAIADNFFTFLPKKPIDIMDKYLDLQRFFQSVFPELGKNQVGLKTAAEILGISVDELSLHRASDDSALTAMIFDKIRNKGDFLSFTVDTTQKNFFERLYFRPFMVTDINSPLINKENLVFKCRHCGADAVLKKDWNLKNNQFYGEFKCPECKRSFIGRLCVKRYFDQTKVRKTYMSIKKKKPQNTAVSTVSRS